MKTILMRNTVGRFWFWCMLRKLMFSGGDINVVQKGTEPPLDSTEDGLEIRRNRELGHALTSRLLNAEQHYIIKVADVPSESLLSYILGNSDDTVQ
jgi:hypothetical protein